MPFQVVIGHLPGFLFRHHTGLDGHAEIVGAGVPRCSLCFEVRPTNRVMGGTTVTTPPSSPI